jgi:hypothetical protein
MYRHAGLCLSTIHQPRCHSKGRTTSNKFGAKIKAPTSLENDFIEVSPTNITIFRARLLEFLETILGTFAGHTFDIVRMEQKISDYLIYNWRMDENSKRLLDFHTSVHAVHKINWYAGEELLFLLP